MKNIKRVPGANGLTVFLTIALCLAFWGRGWSSPIPASDQKQGLAVSFKVSGNLSYLLDGGGDLEKTRKGLEDAVAESRSLGYWKSVTFDWKRPGIHAEAYVDLIIHLGPRLGVGLGTGYLVSSTQGDLGLYDDYSGTLWGYAYSESQKIDYDRQYRISAIPIRFDIYYTLPLSRSQKWTLWSHAGVGYYFGKLHHQYTYTGHSEYTETYGSYYSYSDTYDYLGQLTEKATCNAWGIHGGLGLNFNANRLISFGAEVYGRYVNFSNWKGDSTLAEKTTYDYNYGGYYHYQYQYEDYNSKHGFLWTYEMLGARNKYCCMWISDREPAAQGIFNVRKSAINLNALGIQFFIRLRFSLI